MKITIKKIFLNNAQIKIISLLLGYSFWYVLSQTHIANIWLDVPISFYKLPKNIQVDAPEKIKIQLSGKRADLYTIERENLAFHVTMDDANTGCRTIKLSQEQLLLPNSIKLVRCKPTNIQIAIKEKETEQENA